MRIPKGHPRYHSLQVRHRLLQGLRDGLVTEAGLIAQGRGEAFDYLLGERSPSEARRAARAAAALLLQARRPVISVNGNSAALAPRDLARISRLLGAPLEVNLFYTSATRERRIAAHLRAHGAPTVLLGGGARVPGPAALGPRARVHPRGIAVADVVLVPLEDGDRTGALIRAGKKVVAVDLNPLSRTARTATVTIVDNLVRAAPLLAETLRGMKGWPEERLERAARFDNRGNLDRVVERMVRRWTGIRR
ncbi:MAG: phosphopantothenate/pantothenate synthetase [Euryarchaeota archaeon]|nr:phosphopantothenate/pantothenate synthetase [Euryarchaeota archaeon]